MSDQDPRRVRTGRRALKQLVSSIFATARTSGTRPYHPRRAVPYSHASVPETRRRPMINGAINSRRGDGGGMRSATGSGTEEAV